MPRSPDATIPRGRRRAFQRRLLAWYAANGRDLPWRRTRDPYAILVSEVLSHQTQIARVVPVYEAFLRRYPTVQALARAPLAEIKSLTDPLGYKVRGRWLQSAALQVAELHGGYFPETAEALQRLPGVGRYTAGALMSFAQHQDAPILDTNVARVLRRYFGVPSGRRAQTRQLWALAGAILPRGRGPLINQALMDFGALVCRSRRPRCEGCPLRRGCRLRPSLPERSRKVW